MDLTETRVYDLGESLVAAGFPMLTEYDPEVFGEQASILKVCTRWPEVGADGVLPQLKRAATLAKNPADSGHANFLKGVLVAVNVTAPIKWWVQAQRYSHFTIVSSQSTMHRGPRFNLRRMLPLGFPDDLIKLLEGYQAAVEKGEMSKEDFVKLLPTGLEYTARVTTNYLQLKIMYQQRRTHTLEEWGVVCDWCKTLPLSSLITGIEPE